MAQLRAAASSLTDYVESHFDFEETLKSRPNYGFLKPDQKVYALFIRRRVKFACRTDAGADLAGESLELLTSWLLNPIACPICDQAKTVKASLERLPDDIDSSPTSFTVLTGLTDFIGRLFLQIG